MSIIKKIVLAIVVAIAGVMLFALTKPDSFSVERSISIKAPPEKIFPLLNDFKAWALWSPWEHKDPAMSRTFSNTTSGVGASYAWQGNSQVGEGRMEITESVPPSKLLVRLSFFKPMAAENMAEFTLMPAGESTTVRWRMYGPSPYLSKVFQVFMSMDTMVGADFEAGLASLRAQAEKP